MPLATLLGILKSALLRHIMVVLYCKKCQNRNTSPASSTPYFRVLYKF